MDPFSDSDSESCDQSDHRALGTVTVDHLNVLRLEYLSCPQDCQKEASAGMVWNEDVVEILRCYCINEISGGGKRLTDEHMNDLSTFTGVHESVMDVPRTAESGRVEDGDSSHGRPEPFSTGAK
jgi:hypothetical protein